MHGLQAAKEILGFPEDGEEPKGIPVNHDAEDRLLPLSADAFELVRYGDEPLHFPEVACSYLLKGRTKLQTTLPFDRGGGGGRGGGEMGSRNVN